MFIMFSPSRRTLKPAPQVVPSRNQPLNNFEYPKDILYRVSFFMTIVSKLKGIEAAKQNEKTIVLVEGTSDKTILEFCLQRIYPHLFDLFYFMDFDDGHGHKRSNSGVSEISKCMETFYYSRIKKNIQHLRQTVRY